jgi:hypothetical protein
MMIIIILVVLIIFWYIFPIVFNKREKLTDVNEDHELKAFDYSLDEMCKHKGYKVVNVPAGTMVDEYDLETETIIKVPLEESRNECRHTKETCLKASVFPQTETDIYLEWKDGNCIMGNAAFGDFCKSKNLEFDPVSGLCRVNRQYCRDKEVGWDNDKNDCIVAGGQGVAEFFFGTTITRTVDKGLGALVGRCTTPPCKENEGCLQGKGDCDDGLFCSGFSTCKKKLPENSACSTDDACQGDMWCGDFPLKCHKRRDIGGYCPLDSKACNTNLYCDAGSKCAKKLDDGATCSKSQHCSSDKCGKGLSCLNKDGEALRGTNCSIGDKCMSGDFCNGIGYCEKKLGDGSACSTDSACTSNKCGKGGACLNSKGINVGGSCANLLGTSTDNCGDGKFCSGFGLLSKCAKKLGDGATCAKGPDCTSGKCGKGWSCLNNDGKALRGKNCSLGDDCISGDFCDGLGKCAKKLGDGATCSTDSACSSNKCGDGWSCLNSDGKALRGKNCSFGDNCITGDFCDSIGYCRRKQANDAPCSTGSACTSGNCVSSLCRPAGEKATVKTFVENTPKAVGKVIANGATALANYVSGF